MKLGIVGTRTFTDYDLFKKKLLKKYDIAEIDEIVSGGADGTDTLAEMFAKEFEIKFKVYKPNWDKYGKRCYAIRNAKIVERCTKLVAFWDGKSPGTSMTINMAKSAKKSVKIYTIPI